MLTVENQRQTSLVAVLHLCLDIKLYSETFRRESSLIHINPVHCYIRHSLRRSQHILGTSKQAGQCSPAAAGLFCLVIREESGSMFFGCFDLFSFFFDVISLVLNYALWKQQVDFFFFHYSPFQCRRVQNMMSLLPKCDTLGLSMVPGTDRELRVFAFEPPPPCYFWMDPLASKLFISSKKKTTRWFGPFGSMLPLIKVKLLLTMLVMVLEHLMPGGV